MLPVLNYTWHSLQRNPAACCRDPGPPALGGSGPHNRKCISSWGWVRKIGWSPSIWKKDVGKKILQRSIKSEVSWEGDSGVSVMVFSNKTVEFVRGQVQNKPKEVASYPSMVKLGNSLLQDFAEAE